MAKTRLSTRSKDKYCHFLEGVQFLSNQTFLAWNSYKTMKIFLFFVSLDNTLHTTSVSKALSLISSEEWWLPSTHSTLLIPCHHSQFGCTWGITGKSRKCPPFCWESVRRKEVLMTWVNSESTTEVRCRWWQVDHPTHTSPQIVYRGYLHYLSQKIIFFKIVDS